MARVWYCRGIVDSFCLNQFYIRLQGFYEKIFQQVSTYQKCTCLQSGVLNVCLHRVINEKSPRFFFRIEFILKKPKENQQCQSLYLTCKQNLLLLELEESTHEYEEPAYLSTQCRGADTGHDVWVSMISALYHIIILHEKMITTVYQLSPRQLCHLHQEH